MRGREEALATSIAWEFDIGDEVMMLEILGGSRVATSSTGGVGRSGSEEGALLWLVCEAAIHEPGRAAFCCGQRGEDCSLLPGVEECVEGLRNMCEGGGGRGSGGATSSDSTGGGGGGGGGKSSSSCSSSGGGGRVGGSSLPLRESD